MLCDNVTLCDGMVCVVLLIEVLFSDEVMFVLLLQCHVLFFDEVLLLLLFGDLVLSWRHSFW